MAIMEKTDAEINRLIGYIYKIEQDRMIVRHGDRMKKTDTKIDK